MGHFRFTNKAVEDLSDIWNYTCETWSEKQADKYYGMLLDICKKIAVKPGAGKRYDEVYADLLGYKANQHIIFYRTISDKEVAVVRILHGRMDLKKRIME